MAAAMPPPSPRVLLVFDYDWSLVDDNSDTFIFAQLAPELLEELSTRRIQQPSWPLLMDELLGELVQRRPDLTREDLVRTVASVPVQDGMLDALRGAVDQHHASVKIVSDANTIYIQSMLERHALSGYISEVVSNPARWQGEESNRLRVAPYHAVDQAPHGCALCPANMCKGRILDAILVRETFDKVIYVGDGGGDLCAALRLTERDVVLARGDDAQGRSFVLLRKLAMHQDQMRARVLTWRTGLDVLAHVQRELQTAHHSSSQPNDDKEGEGDEDAAFYALRN